MPNYAKCAGSYGITRRLRGIWNLLCGKQRGMRLMAFLAVAGFSLLVLLGIVGYPHYYERDSALKLRRKGFRVFFEEKKDWVSRNVTTYCWHATVVYAPEGGRVNGSLQVLDAFPDLETLVLWDTDLTDEMLSPVPGLHKLRQLVLSGTSVSAKGATYIGGCRRLEQLDLRRTRVDDSALARLAGLVGLVNLDLGATYIGDHGLSYIKELHNLEFLNLSETEVGDSSLHNLLSMGRLRNLDLRGTHITDQGLQIIGQLRTLEVLNLSSTRISDEGLLQLMNLKALGFLKLHATEVSEGGIEYLGMALPRLYIDMNEVE
jgi:hypothetical protein